MTHRTSQKTIDQLLDHWTFNSPEDRIAAQVMLVTVIARFAGLDSGPCPYFATDKTLAAAAAMCAADRLEVVALHSVARALRQPSTTTLIVRDVPMVWDADDQWMHLYSLSKPTFLLCVPSIWSAGCDDDQRQDMGRRIVRIDAVVNSPVLPMGASCRVPVWAAALDLLNEWNGNPLRPLNLRGAFARGSTETLGLKPIAEAA